MSTPVDPQDSTAGADRTGTTPPGDAGDNLSQAGGTNGRMLDAATDRSAAATTRWSDADVSDRSADRLGTTQLPPVHVTSAQRQPEVHIRDAEQTVEQPAYRQPVQQEPVQEEPVQVLPVHERLVTPEPELRAQPMAVGVLPDRQTVVARERARFGGMKFGSAFFGWLTATGLAVLLLAILAAAGVAFGVATSKNVNQAVSQSQNATGTAKTVGLVGAIVLLVILFVAYYCGGYVAGRMARFDGVRQGLGVWIWAIITSAVIAGVAAIAGAKYNVLAQLNLPRIPVDEGSVTTVGIIAIAAAILVALLGALLGGAVGTRYHRKVDAVGFEVEEAG